MFSELAFYIEGHIGQEVYIGRFLFVWAILYLTFFLGSQRKVVQGILFAAGAIASVTGIVLMLSRMGLLVVATDFRPFQHARLGIWRR